MDHVPYTIADALGLTFAPARTVACPSRSVARILPRIHDDTESVVGRTFDATTETSAARHVIPVQDPKR
jgi:hypothetical protein